MRISLQDPFEGEVWTADRGARLRVNEHDVVGVTLLTGEPAAETPGTRASPLLDSALVQVGQYLEGTRRDFDLPLWLSGSAFYRRAWQALREIPYGQTRTYAQLAASLGNPGAVRAVGGAMGANPLPLLLPCHRVVASGGRLGGYSAGDDWKRWLLRLEQGGKGELALEI